MGFIKDLYFNRYGAKQQGAEQPAAEVTRRTHQSTGGSAMPVGRSTAPVATNNYTYDQAAEGMKRFHGNVDLYHRPVVSSEAMNNAGYNIPAGNTATVYSMQRGIRDKSGRVREVLYTPITATGEVMSQKDIDAYIDGLDGSDDILAADKAGKGMIIHLDANPNGNDGQDLHLMQEAYGRGPQQTNQTQPGQAITQQQVKDAVDKVAHDIQQRSDTRKQEELARNRHQYSADPMNRLFAPGNTQVQQQQPQQSSGTVDQARPANNQPQVTNMDELTAAIERARREVDEANETPEQKAAREKREKNQRLLATIGDGLGAFHEAYSHMRDIKPMTNGSIQAKQEARIRALGLERDKKYSDALQNYIKVMDMKRKNEYYNSIAETRRKQQESQDRDREEKRREAARLNDARIELYKARQGKLIDESAYNQAYTDAIRSGLPESEAIEKGLAASKASLDELARQQRAESDAKVNATNAQANQRNAAASASNARAAKTRAGGSSGGTYTTTTTTYDKNGNVKGTKVTTKSKGGGGSRRSSSKGNNGNKKRKSKTST